MKGADVKLSVDSIIFTIEGNKLEILLIKRKNPPFQNMYALPGGFVNDGEEIEDAAKRELKEETGITDIFLKELGSYGKVDRDPRARIITIAYMALIRPDQKIKADTDALDAAWFSVYSLPQLAFDHKKIINDALEQLRYEIQTTNIAFQILPKKFTMSQLQHLYELVLDRPLDKRNFRKRIKEFGILKEHNETIMEGAHRPAVLYSFSSNKYSNIRDKISVFLK